MARMRTSTLKLQTAKPERKGNAASEGLELLRALWALAHALDSRSKHMQQTLGVTGPQRFVVRMIGQSPGCSAGSIAEAMRVHPSTLTGVLRRLEKQKLVVRTVDSKDRRRALFVLTEAGRRVNAHTAQTVEASVRKTLQRLTPQEVGTAHRFLGVLVEELEI